MKKFENKDLGDKPAATTIPKNGNQSAKLATSGVQPDTVSTHASGSATGEYIDNNKRKKADKKE